MPARQVSLSLLLSCAAVKPSPQRSTLHPRTIDAQSPISVHRRPGSSAHSPKDYERKILAADERISEIERQLYVDVRSSVAGKASRLRKTAAAIAKLDVLASFAKLAADRNYVRPEFNGTGELLIIGGRHPVIEE